MLLLTLLGCDPTSGLADTADAALPTVKRYFDGRGSRVADGPWNRVVVDLDSETLYHVGARRLDDDEPTFHLFGVDAQDGCNVSPNAGTWLMGKPRAAPFRVLPYLEDIDETGRGNLRFTTLDCQVQDVAIADAGRPYPRLYDDGYLVPTGARGYTFVDPWSGKTDVIAEDLQTALVWKGYSLLWDAGSLKAYSDQFQRGDQVGQGVVAVVPIGDAFLVEDTTGLHRVTFDPISLSLTTEPVLDGACGLQRSLKIASDTLGGWIMLQLPCGNPRPSMVHVDENLELVEEPVELPLEVDSRDTRALASAAGKEGPMPVATLYLTDVSDGLGTLWALPAGADSPIQLGERAGLDSVFLETSDSDWDGVAHTNYQTLGGFTAHDWLQFRWNGETALIAERIVHNSSSGELLVNFDGVAGDLPLFAADGLSIVAEDLPPHSGEATSYVGTPRHARIDHFDGTSGRVTLSATPSDPTSWVALGDGVVPESVRFAWFMPALLFLENWDAERNTGSLVAYNYELDARATIAEGVSSFDLTSYPWDGVIYAVPSGREKGLWFSKAK